MMTQAGEPKSIQSFAASAGNDQPGIFGATTTVKLKKGNLQNKMVESQGKGTQKITEITSKNSSAGGTVEYMSKNSSARVQGDVKEEGQAEDHRAAGDDGSRTGSKKVPS